MTLQFISELEALLIKYNAELEAEHDVTDKLNIKLSLPNNRQFNFGPLINKDSL